MVYITDKQLIIGLKRRDLEMYEACIDKYKNYVGAIIVRQIGSSMEKEDIEEVVSDVFFAIWKQADKINIDNEENYNLKAYLASVARNMAINKLRQKSKLKLIPFENNVHKNGDKVCDDFGERQVYQSCDNVLKQYSNPEDYIVNKESMEQVSSAIEMLGSPDKEIFIQYICNDMTINQISVDYGINENTIKSKLSRCRKKLKKYFNNIK